MVPGCSFLYLISMTAIGARGGGGAQWQGFLGPGILPHLPERLANLCLLHLWGGNTSPSAVGWECATWAKHYRSAGSLATRREQALGSHQSIQNTKEVSQGSIPEGHWKWCVFWLISSPSCPCWLKWGLMPRESSVFQSYEITIASWVSSIGNWKTRPLNCWLK